MQRLVIESTQRHLEVAEVDCLVPALLDVAFLVLAHAHCHGGDVNVRRYCICTEGPDRVPWHVIDQKEVDLEARALDEILGDAETTARGRRYHVKRPAARKPGLALRLPELTGGGGLHLAPGHEVLDRKWVEELKCHAESFGEELKSELSRLLKGIRNVAQWAQRESLKKGAA